MNALVAGKAKLNCSFRGDIFSAGALGVFTAKAQKCGGKQVSNFARGRAKIL